MLSKIKQLLGIASTDTSKDSLLNLLIELAQDDAKHIINSTILTGLDNVIIQMVVFKYNRLGSEGVDSEEYSGVSYTYSTDYPEFIKAQLRMKRRIGVIDD